MRDGNGQSGRGVSPRRPGTIFYGGVVRWRSAAALLGLPLTAVAQPVPETITGVPQQIIPAVGEFGLPAWNPPTGSGSIGGTDNGGSGGGSGGGNNGGAADALLAQQAWGLLAAQNAGLLGVSTDALASTCMIESGCQNVGGTGTIQGAFQMSASTYTAMIAAALQDNPNLASQIVPGLAGQMDPATQAIAAAEYLKQGAEYLQANGISNPTVLEVRGYYNFGPAAGIALAGAGDSQLASQVLSGFSAQTLAANGIILGETVAQWRAATTSKLGGAAGSLVLTG